MASNLREYHKRLRRKLKNLKIDKSVIKYTDDVLGRGSYAVVVALEVNSLECAGKILHDALFDWSSNEEKVYLVDKFAEECIRLGELRHPNIVQLLGVDYDETSITLVMERLPMSLSECLERYEDIPDFIKNAILLDVALGLNYLHKQEPPIIHRDLSTNNVMLTSTLQAKIADLGVARALQPKDGALDSFEPMTMVPGNQIVMPPEALINAIDESGKALAVYDTKLDCFSFGNVIVQVVCQTDQLKLPDHESDPAYPSEARRRSRYLQTMNDHPLYKLTVQCLENNPQERPSADDIVRYLRGIIFNDPPPFENQIVMFKAFLSNNKALQCLQVEALQKSWAQDCSDGRCELEVAGLKAKIETLECELKKMNADVTTMNATIAAKELVIQNLNTQLSWNATDSTSNNQLLQQEVVEARKTTSLTSLQPSELADMPGEAAPCIRPRPRGTKDGSNQSLSFPSQQSTSVGTTPRDKSCNHNTSHHPSELPSPVPRPRRPRVSRLSSDTSVSPASSSTTDRVGETFTPESPSTIPRRYPNKEDVRSTHNPQLYEGTEHRHPPKVPAKMRHKPSAKQQPTSDMTAFQEFHALTELPKPQSSDSYRFMKNTSMVSTNLAKFAGDPELRRRLAEQHEKTVTNIPSLNIQKLEQKKGSVKGLDDDISSMDPELAK